MTPYPAYKDSGIEWLEKIPVGWNTVLLKRILEGIKDGTHGTFERVDNGRPLLSAKNVFSDGMRISDGESLISETDFNEIVKNGFPCKGDILLTIVGTIGRTFVYNLDSPLAFQRSVAFLRLKSSLNPYYYYYFFQTFYFVETLYASAKTSAQSGVYMRDVVQVPVIHPPLPEQRDIADFLDHKTRLIDTYVAKKQQQVERLQAYRAALINQAVTKGLNPDTPMKDSGIEWLGEIPKHWEKLKIKRLSKVKRGASPRPIEDPKYFDEDGEFGWVRIADVTASERYLEQTTQTLSELGASLSVKRHPGDFFVSIAGSVGKPIITKIKCCIHDGFVYFPELKIDPEFLYYIFFAGELYKGLEKWGTQLNLNTETIGDIYIGLPSGKEIDQIVAFLDEHTAKIDTLIAATQRQIERLQAYRASLISDAVTGKIDVRKETDTEPGAVGTEPRLR